jgi:hypothetical protein
MGMSHPSNALVDKFQEYALTDLTPGGARRRGTPGPARGSAW